jgi:hypothetical protein
MNTDQVIFPSYVIALSISLEKMAGRAPSPSAQFRAGAIQAIRRRLPQR